MKKRTVVLALVLALAVVAIACGSKAVTPPPAPLTPPPPPVAPPAPDGGGLPSAAEGKVLAAQHACSACHSVDGNVSVGPTWKGLYDKEVTLAGGQKVSVDEDYLRESILTPNAKVADGFFPGIMPQDFRTHLSDQQVRSLIEYIRTLK